MKSDFIAAPFEWFRGNLFQETTMTNENLPPFSTSVLDAPLGETAAYFSPPWVRLGARLFASSLDSKLAAGVHPATNHLLAARAQRLASTHYRRGLADSWLDLLIEVRRPRRAFDPVVPLVRSRVLAAETQIRTLADTLVSPLPTVHGLAMAIETLRDGAGPLFNPSSPVKLSRSLDAILTQLNPLTAANSF
jgi:hypothetical protein